MVQAQSYFFADLQIVSGCHGATLKTTEHEHKFNDNHRFVTVTMAC